APRARARRRPGRPRCGSLGDGDGAAAPGAAWTTDTPSAGPLAPGPWLRARGEPRNTGHGRAGSSARRPPRCAPAREVGPMIERGGSSAVTSATRCADAAADIDPSWTALRGAPLFRDAGDEVLGQLAAAQLVLRLELPRDTLLEVPPGIRDPLCLVIAGQMSIGVF